MAWWGWLIIGVHVTLLVVLLILLLRKKPHKLGLSEEERKRIQQAEQANVAEQIAIEKEKNASLAKVASQLRTNLSQLQAEFERRKDQIDEEKRKEMERLSGDNDLLGAELDKLLGISRDEPGEE